MTVLQVQVYNWHWGDMFFKVICRLVIGPGINWLQAQVQNFSLSKNCLVVSITSLGSFWFSEHNLGWALAHGCWKLFPVFFYRIHFNIRHQTSEVLNIDSFLVHSVITEKSQTSTGVDVLTEPNNSKVKRMSFQLLKVVYNNIFKL